MRVDRGELIRALMLVGFNSLDQSLYLMRTGVYVHLVNGFVAKESLAMCVNLVLNV